ncbi:derlin-1-like isoform X1 [Centruroides sculpturatus]|uniref:derlin-1-like isoform X1 n=1 Tax=Centruroides sculpturatus TaxID=218467 RepID=UPI000C6D71BB|nr:derlin-1-like isoform X1 [Centruroides sculpturatus]
MSDIGDWFRSLPLFTRYWFGLSIFFPILGRLGLLNPRYLILEFNSFIYNLQLWRPITAVFYYPLNPGTGFHYLLNLYFLYNYSVRLETDIFSNQPADYLFLLLFNWICIVIVGFLAEIWLLMDPLVLSVLYVWCQLKKDIIVNFWFGTQFKALYLPWVLLAFNVLFSGGGLYELIGILVGHLYFFFKFKYPQEFGGRALLRTPDILLHYFPNRVRGFGGFGQAPTPRRQPDDNNQRRYNWGRGHILGNQ